MKTSIRCGELFSELELKPTVTYIRASFEIRPGGAEVQGVPAGGSRVDSRVTIELRSEWVREQV